MEALLRTQLLTTTAFRVVAGDAIDEVSSSILVISAFLTQPGVDWLSARIGDKSPQVVLMTRWDPRDLIVGVSDLCAYESARERGWAFYIYAPLHAKVMLIDDRLLVIGSANLTSPGMGLGNVANLELGIGVAPTKEDTRLCWALLENATLMTDALYDRVRLCIDNLKTAPAGALQWPDELIMLMRPKVKRLWTTELPWLTLDELVTECKTGGGGRDVSHDLDLLGLDRNACGPSVSHDQLRTLVLMTSAWQWLRGALGAEPLNEAYFGRLTVLLESALLDDPRPYRQETKRLLANLLSYAGGIADVVVDRPSHSQRARLKPS